jgi:Protein of unknown function (DUF3108)
MQKGKLIFIGFLFIVLTSFIAFSTTKQTIPTTVPNDGFCGITNTAFMSGEQITFHVYYSVIGTYLHAGTAIFTCVNEKYNGKNTYHIEGIGNSNAKYDFIFKVRDKYESWLDTSSFLPLKFNRKVQEGKYKKTETITFNHDANKATSLNKTYTIPKCVQDVLSATYYARNIDFDKLAIGDKVTFSMTLDDEVYSMYIKYMGKEKVKTKYGKFNAIKFKPLLIKGTIFEGGEKMTVWVSDDPNRLVLRVNSPISVGSVKVDMMSYRNLRYPLTSLISIKN